MVLIIRVVVFSVFFFSLFNYFTLCIVPYLWSMELPIKLSNEFFFFGVTCDIHFHKELRLA